MPRRPTFRFVAVLLLFSALAHGHVRGRRSNAATMIAITRPHAGGIVNRDATPGPSGPAAAIVSTMGGYRQLIRGEPSRGIFPRNFGKPIPFEPGQPDRITFVLSDVAHTSGAGHRIMAQIRTSWFPLNDRNPDKFMAIPKALSTDFVKATQRVYFGGSAGSKITFRIEQ